MPTDVISATCRAELFGSHEGFRRKSVNGEVKSGFLVLLGPGGIRQDVRVAVYRTSLEQFAVIYPKKRLTKPTGVVNLRNTGVERAESVSGFVVRQKGYDNTISAKFLCPERDVEPWLAAFQCRTPPVCQQVSLPVLIEAEES